MKIREEIQRAQEIANNAKSYAASYSEHKLADAILVLIEIIRALEKGNEDSAKISTAPIVDGPLHNAPTLIAPGVVP